MKHTQGDCYLSIAKPDTAYFAAAATAAEKKAASEWNHLSGLARDLNQRPNRTQPCIKKLRGKKWMNMNENKKRKVNHIPRRKRKTG